MNNTMAYALWFMMMLAFAIGLAVTTTAGPSVVVSNNSPVRMEQSIVPHAAGGSVSTSDDHFWSLLVAKSARSKLELLPVRVGRHHVPADKKSTWTLSVEHRRHYTLCVVVFDMTIIAMLTTILINALNKRTEVARQQWATHLLAIVEAAKKRAEKMELASEAAKIPATLAALQEEVIPIEEEIPAEVIPIEEEMRPLAPQVAVPAKETRSLASRLKEAKGELACLSTARCASEECQQSEALPELHHDDNDDQFQLDPMLMGQFIDVALLPPVDIHWCERIKSQHHQLQQQQEEEGEQDQELDDDDEEWVELEDPRGRHAGPEEAPLDPMTMGQFFDAADFPPAYDQQLQAVLSRLPAALLNATDLSQGGMWDTLA